MDLPAQSLRSRHALTVHVQPLLIGPKQQQAAT
jgi:hypothetical protein